MIRKGGKPASVESGPYSLARFHIPHTSALLFRYLVTASVRSVADLASSSAPCAAWASTPFPARPARPDGHETLRWLGPEQTPQPEPDSAPRLFALALHAKSIQLWLFA